MATEDGSLQHPAAAGQKGIEGRVVLLADRLQKAPVRAEGGGFVSETKWTLWALPR